MATSSVKKRSIVLGGHKTSVSLEDEFWEGLRAIARDRCTTVGTLAQEIDQGRRAANLSSAIRLFVLAHLVARLRDLGERTPIVSGALARPATSA